MAIAKKSTESTNETADVIPQTTSSKLRKLIIQNFGCIGNSPVTIELDDIVVLVGPNNAGKSTILRAYQKITESSAPELTLEDFHERKVNPMTLPSIELVTAVVEDLPGSRWIQNVDAEVDKEKPYNAYQTLKQDADAYGRVKELLLALVDFSNPLPQKCVQWSNLSQLQASLTK